MVHHINAAQQQPVDPEGPSRADRPGDGSAQDLPKAAGGEPGCQPGRETDGGAGCGQHQRTRLDAQRGDPTRTDRSPRASRQDRLAGRVGVGRARRRGAAGGAMDRGGVSAGMSAARLGWI